MVTAKQQAGQPDGNHVDVLIVGAGISGVGSAYHLQEQCPEKTYVILEMKDTFGGTWETHKYPGIRSDSDLYTFGYRFKPWIGAPIASAEEILKYMGDVIEENGIEQHIRYGHRIDRCSWSSADNLWTVEATRLSDDAVLTFTCSFPDGDVFRAAAADKLTVVTDTIDTFTETGVRTASGEEIEADIIVAATGFRLSVMGDIPFDVDGRPVDWHETINYRGMMFSGVPNLLWVFGYFRASWTLRVDMLGDFVCRLLKHMDAIGARRVDVALRDEDADMELLPWIEEENFNPGYLMRGLDRLPRRGAKPEWRHNQDYWTEREEIPAIDLDGEEFVYDGARRSGRDGGRGEVVDEVDRHLVDLGDELLDLRGDPVVADEHGNRDAQARDGRHQGLRNSVRHQFRIARAE